jgi:hypothetical protein
MAMEAAAKTVCQQHTENFETLRRAFRDGNVAMMECREVATGEVKAVICAVSKYGEAFVFTPFAAFYNGNPYEMLEPPEPGGGFTQGEAR